MTAFSVCMAAVDYVTGLEQAAVLLFDSLFLSIGLLACDLVIEHLHIGCPVQGCGIPMNNIQVKSLLVHIIAECRAVGVCGVLLGAVFGGICMSLPAVLSGRNHIACYHTGIVILEIGLAGKICLGNHNQRLLLGSVKGTQGGGVGGLLLGGGVGGSRRGIIGLCGGIGGGGCTAVIGFDGSVGSLIARSALIPCGLLIFAAACKGSTDGAQCQNERQYSFH